MIDTIERNKAAERDIPFLREKLQTFFVSPPKNQWLHVRGMEIYVRKSIRLLKRGEEARSCFDIANVGVKDIGKGYFTAVLPVIEQEVKMANRFDAIYVENVMELRFAGFFEKQGYIPVPALNFSRDVAFPICLFKVLKSLEKS